jgi:hypothetical protein
VASFRGAANQPDNIQRDSRIKQKKSSGVLIRRISAKNIRLNSRETPTKKPNPKKNRAKTEIAGFFITSWTIGTIKAKPIPTAIAR